MTHLYLDDGVTNWKFTKLPKFAVTSRMYRGSYATVAITGRGVLYACNSSGSLQRNAIMVRRTRMSSGFESDLLEALCSFGMIDRAWLDTLFADQKKATGDRSLESLKSELAEAFTNAKIKLSDKTFGKIARAIADHGISYYRYR